LIFYITDNQVSHTVARAFEKSGAEVDHVKNFWLETSGHASPNPTPIFYGILRGSGSAMRTCQFLNQEFIYVDNGYFDAVYMDQYRYKDMSGKYRVVKNGLLEIFTGPPVRTEPRRPLKVLALPPSPYSAFMHDTTPEDWFVELKHIREKTKDHVDLRTKDHKMSLTEHIQDYDAVFAFNSMAVMEAIRQGKAVYTKHGVINNWDKIDSEIQYFDYKKMENFYETRQFTLEEIGGGLWRS
jgi:hypothetical protein